MGSSKRQQRGLKAPMQMRSRTTRSSKGRLLTDPAENTLQLNSQLRQLGLYPANTLGDGNCLFRALSDQFYGTESHHMQLRKDVCDWIEKHKARYEPFVEDERGIDVHLRLMRQPATYGGHLELSAFAHMARRDVKVIQPGLVYVIEWASGWDSSAPSTTTATATTTTTASTSTASASTSAASTSASAATSASAGPSDIPSAVSVDDAMDGQSRRAARAAKRDKLRAEKEMKEVGGGKKVKKVEQQQQQHPQAGGDEEGEERMKSGGTVYVAYHDWEHFSSIRNLRGPHQGLPQVHEWTLSSASDVDDLPPAPSPPSTAKISKAKATRSSVRAAAKPEGSSASASAPPVLTGKKVGKDKEGEKVPAKMKGKRESLRRTAASKAASASTSTRHTQTQKEGTSSTSAPPTPSQIPLPGSRSVSPSQVTLPSTSFTVSTATPTSRDSTSTTASDLSMMTAPPLSERDRDHRSPKRTFDESSGDGEDSEHSAAKRSRRGEDEEAEVEEDVDEGDEGGGDVEMRYDEEDGSDADDMDEDGEEDEAEGATMTRRPTILMDEADADVDADADTPSLSETASTSSDTSSSSSPLPPPPPPASASAPPAPVDRPLTRRQRKALGLPSPRVAERVVRGGAGGKTKGAGKIVIPGGRFRKGGAAAGKRGKKQTGEGEEVGVVGKDGEWMRNGVGRVDVRGFRELRI